MQHSVAPEAVALQHYSLAECPGKRHGAFQIVEALGELRPRAANIFEHPVPITLSQSVVSAHVYGQKVKTNRTIYSCHHRYEGVSVEITEAPVDMNNGSVLPLRAVQNAV